MGQDADPASRCACERASGGGWSLCPVHGIPATLGRSFAEEEEQLAKLERLQCPAPAPVADDSGLGGIGPWEHRPVAMGEHDDALASMNVRELKGLLEEGGIDFSACVEKEELLVRARELQDKDSAEEAKARRDRARRRWKEAALKEGQRLRVEALREKQSREARDAARKHELAQRLEAELEQRLGGRPFEAILAHFGAPSFKKLLVEFHPDRTPKDAGFEETVRRETIFKFVQQQKERGDAQRPTQSTAAAAAETDLQRWARERRERDVERAREEEVLRRAAQKAAREQEASRKAAAAERERQRTAVPEDAAFRVVSEALGSLSSDRGADGPFGYYAQRGERNGRPLYRKLVRVARADWAPWAAQAKEEAEESAEAVYWTGTFWELGTLKQRHTIYMAVSAEAKPPAEGWDVVDSRAPVPRLEWL